MASTSVSANDPLRIGVIVLTVGTALIHLYLGLQGIPLFILNGLGYLGLLAALILPIPASQTTGTSRGGFSSGTQH
jgi:hypothetical protein